MKIENTLENKAKFFAQYWGQHIMVDPTIDERIFPVTTGNIEYSINDPHLELKSLSSITDEDLIKCYHLHSAIIGYDYTMDFKPMLEMAKHWHENGGVKNIIKYTDSVDFLRSKGYALPWMGISVEQQIEWGWVKNEVEKI